MTVVHPTYNGRPSTRIGPPITIYNRAFAIIRDRLKDLSKESLAPDHVVDTPALNAAAVIYDEENEREDATYPILERLLGVTFDRKFKASYSSGTAAESVAAAVFELEDGSKACPRRTYERIAKWCTGSSHSEKAYSYYRLRQTTQLVTLPLPADLYRRSLRLLCRIYVFSTQQLTDYIYLGADDLHRTERVAEDSKIFSIFRDTLKDLTEYYQSLTLSYAPSHSRLYPSPTYEAQSPGPIQFMERLRFPRWNNESYHCSLFKAKLGDEPVIVKFCQTYGEEAHTIVAAAGLAPRLRSLGHCAGG